MTSLRTLLLLPNTSQGFTALQSSILDDGSASPPRKVARLDSDSDSPSASRSQLRGKKPGPIKLQIIGDHVPRPVDASQQLAFLKRSIRIILTREGPDTLPSTYESIYSTCRSVVCIADQGEDLYGILKLGIEQCVSGLATSVIDTPGDGAGWIAAFVGVCQWFETQVALLRSLLTYLDQVYILNAKIPGIRSLAYVKFVGAIFDNPQIAERLKSSVERWVNGERENIIEQSSRQQISLLVAHLATHQQYANFEEHYLSVTRDFYAKESAHYAEKMRDNATGFFEHVYNRIQQEDARCKALLPVGTWSLVRQVTEQSLFAGRLDWVANATVGKYIEAKDLSTLSTMYNLFERVKGVKVLCSAFRTYLETSVQEVVKDPARDDEMVPRLLHLKGLADATVNGAFLNEKVAPTPTRVPGSLQASTSAPPTKLPNQDFVYAIADAFTFGFKARRNKPAEMIARFLDKAMRSGQGATSDEEYEALLDSVLSLYRFTDDKDVFRTFYHRALARRLLLQKSASDDFEASMLKKLKEKYDPEFGMGEEMFKDLALSRESMVDYHSKLPADSPGQKLNVMVLQRSAWPFSVNKKNVDLPPNMQEELTAYTAYYKGRHSGHVLDWDHSLGTATLTARFNTSVKELSVSLYQAVVLLLFNDATELKFPEIMEQTRMDDAELRRTLQSLACGKKKVLKKIPPGRDVGDDDLFRFNADFDDPKAKVHINSIQAKVTPEESHRTQVSIEGDRKHYLDAAIVRIMKAKKELTYEQLKTATIDAVKSHFVPQVDAIKKRVDSLVEGDYLERSKTDKNTFLYVA